VPPWAGTGLYGNRMAPAWSRRRGGRSRA
jgi:hypothetical protein